MKREDIRAIFPEATDEQIDAILNANGSEINEIKSRLTSAQTAHKAALDEQKDEYERQIAELTQKVQKGMSEEEQLKAAIAAAAEQEADFKRKSNTLDAKAIFVEAGIGEDDYKPLLDYVVVEDAKKTKDNAKAIVNLVQLTKETVEKETRDAVLKGNPSPAGGAGKSTLTAEEFSKMSYEEMVAAKQENPELVASFLKG